MSKPNIYDQSFSERMQWIAKNKFDGNYSLFARAVGVVQPSLVRWVKGEADPTRTNLIKIAQAADVSLEWLALGIETQPLETLKSLRTEIDEISMLDSFESIRVSAGFGSFNEGITKADGQIPYDNALLRALGVKPKHCGVFWANGISMQPTIQNGDQLLIDFSRKEVKGNNIYLIQNSDSVWVKRVKMLWDGVELISDNREEYEPIKISNQEAQNLQIIGQVVHVGHSLI